MFNFYQLKQTKKGEYNAEKRMENKLGINRQIPNLYRAVVGI